MDFSRGHFVPLEFISPLDLGVIGIAKCKYRIECVVYAAILTIPIIGLQKGMKIN